MVVASVPMHGLQSLLSDSDGLLYLSLEFVLLTLFNRCVLSAYYVVRVHNMVGNIIADLFGSP